MQRLFTTFPIGWPAAGLLILRGATGFPLIFHGASAIHGIWQPATLILPVAVLLNGVFLLFGLWTPLAGASAVIMELLDLSTGDEEYHIRLAASALSLVMLGPGAWSIDARLFGRRLLKF